jgi:hypothetical protein
MTANEEKRLQKTREKIAEMKARERAIISVDRKRQRKAKTRRLIQIGALTEKLLHCEALELSEVQKILRQIFDLPDISEFVEEIKNP